jgi:REP element-mobilizing transposase RayT
MARLRKRHEQQELPLWKSEGHGGRRPGAGRPRSKGRVGSPHKKRPDLDKRYPVHVTLRVAKGVGYLRRRDIYKALRQTTLGLARRERHLKADGAFRIIHLSIQHDHIHLIVEAEHATALSRGMQAFEISAARRLNAVVSTRRGKRRTGAVFPDRFHQEILTSPRQTRNALSYVLNNWRKHAEDRARFAREWKVDPYSSGVLFTWKERDHDPFLWKWPETYEPMFVYLPTTWLLSVGWRKAKRGPISYLEVPASRRA